MDYFFLGNALLMLGAFALQFGLMDDDGEMASDTGTADTTEPADPLYDPALYGSEETGTSGEDAFDLTGSPLGVAVFLQGGNDLLDASINDDYADGGSGDDEMSMRLGDDIAIGGSGDDTIDGGLGEDTIYGGDGDDQITGNKDDDQVFGGAGDDALTGSGGADMLDGGTGNDVLWGNNEADPGREDDGVDTLIGGEGDDTLHMGAGDQGGGGDGADTFLLYDPGDSGNVAAVTDFDAVNDVIGVVYTPVTDPVSGDPIVPTLSVAASDDGTEGIVSLDGVEVARITGGHELTVGDIALIAEDD